MQDKNNARIAKNSLYLYVRMFFAMAVNLYTSRVILQVMGVEDFGIYSIVGGIVAMFSFLNSAMTNSTQRFLSYEVGKGDFDKLKRTFNASLTIHVAIAVIILILAETIGLWFVNYKLNYPLDRTDAVNSLYQLTIITFLVGIIQVPYRSSLIANENFKVFSYISISEIFLKLFAVVALIYISYDKIIAYGFLLSVVAVLMLLFYIYYCSKNFKECSFKFNYDRELYDKLISYTSWNLFGNIASVGYNQGVNILLNVFFGPVINATRGIAFQVQGAVNTFVLNIQMAVNPQIIKSYADDNKEYMLDLIFKSSKYCCFLLLLISFPILFKTEYILMLWLGKLPAYSILFTRLVLINIIIDSMSGPLMTAAQAHGDIKRYQIVIGLTILMNVPISYLFLKLGFPPQSTMYISLFFTILSLGLRIFLLKGLIDFPIRKFIDKVIWKIILPVLFTIPIIGVLNMQVKMKSNFLTVLVFAAISSLIFLANVYFFGLDGKEKLFVNKKIKKN